MFMACRDPVNSLGIEALGWFHSDPVSWGRGSRRGGPARHLPHSGGSCRSCAVGLAGLGFRRCNLRGSGATQVWPRLPDWIKFVWVELWFGSWGCSISHSNLAYLDSCPVDSWARPEWCWDPGGCKSWKREMSPASPVGLEPQKLPQNPLKHSGDPILCPDPGVEKLWTRKNLTLPLV